MTSHIPKTILSAGLVLLVCSRAILAQESDAAQRLRAQGKQFEEELIEVADGVYTSVTSVGTSVFDDCRRRRTDHHRHGPDDGCRRKNS